MPRASRLASLLLTPTLALVGHAGCGEGDTTPTPAARARPPLTVVRASSTSAPATQLAVQACAGLANRDVGGSVFVELDPHDPGWLDELGLAASETLDEADFLARCAAHRPCVRYDYATQQALLPSILTVASTLGAVPLDDGRPLACPSPVFDAVQAFADRQTPLLATRYAFESFGEQTTGLAMLNPGYDQAPKDPANPALNAPMRPSLVDLVFSRRLFALYLVNGCTKGHDERALLDEIVNAGRWPTPLAVYGYNSTWNTLGGYLYEAQTRCLDSRNMGAVASEAGNLSYYSTVAAPITTPGVVRPVPQAPVAYDPGRTYVAFFVGDGDNLAYMLSTRRDWFRQRVAGCARPAATCPPLTWTISPHLATLAPDVLRWYYDKSRETGRDTFALPPSGHLYAYPSSLAAPEQDAFVAATERDARLLGVTGVVHWEWFDSWRDAEESFLPKYGAAVRGIFPTNVPYRGIAFPWWPKSRFFEVLDGAGGPVVVFRPREWRGVQDDKDEFFLSPSKMADELAGYPRGTVSWVYMTSDGGLTLENSFLAMAALLPPHVTLVSADDATRLALEASGR